MTREEPDTAEQFRLLVENARDHAVFATDTRGLVTTWNSGVENILGYTEAE